MSRRFGRSGAGVTGSSGRARAHRCSPILKCGRESVASTGATRTAIHSPFTGTGSRRAWATLRMGFLMAQDQHALLPEMQPCVAGALRRVVLLRNGERPSGG